MVKLTLKW